MAPNERATRLPPIRGNNWGFLSNERFARPRACGFSARSTGPTLSLWFASRRRDRRTKEGPYLSCTSRCRAAARRVRQTSIRRVGACIMNAKSRREKSHRQHSQTPAPGDLEARMMMSRPSGSPPAGVDQYGAGRIDHWRRREYQAHDLGRSRQRPATCRHPLVTATASRPPNGRPTSPRRGWIGNVCSAHKRTTFSTRRDVSDFIWAWGQFIDHDLDPDSHRQHGFRLISRCPAEIRNSIRPAPARRFCPIRARSPIPRPGPVNRIR